MEESRHNEVLLIENVGPCGPVTILISSQGVYCGQPTRRAASVPMCLGSVCRPPSCGACAYLHAVLLHRPSQGIHSLPANQDAQVNQQHAPDDHKQFLVLDDLQRGREQNAVHVRQRTSQIEVRESGSDGIRSPQWEYLLRLHHSQDKPAKLPAGHSRSFQSLASLTHTLNLVKSDNS